MVKGIGPLGEGCAFSVVVSVNTQVRHLHTRVRFTLGGAPCFVGCSDGKAGLISTGFGWTRLGGGELFKFLTEFSQFGDLRFVEIGDALCVFAFCFGILLQCSLVIEELLVLAIE